MIFSSRATFAAPSRPGYASARKDSAFLRNGVASACGVAAGTFTLGVPEVAEVTPLDGTSTDDVLQTADDFHDVAKVFHTRGSLLRQAQDAFHSFFRVRRASVKVGFPVALLRPLVARHRRGIWHFGQRLVERFTRRVLGPVRDVAFVAPHAHRLRHGQRDEVRERDAFARRQRAGLFQYGFRHLGFDGRHGFVAFSSFRNSAGRRAVTPRLSTPAKFRRL